MPARPQQIQARTVVERGNVKLVTVSGDHRRAVLLFDGDCGFCTTAARWAGKGFRHGERAEAWQLLGDQGLEALGLSRLDVTQAAWWVDANGHRERGHRAVGRALQAGGGWRRGAGRIVLTVPTSWLAAGVYRLVVRWRYRLPGGTPACRVDGGTKEITR
jgi:predicted DCC family thiol-disulfide oxidoreductase YuxK